MTYEPAQAHATVAGWGVVTLGVAIVAAIVEAIVWVLGVALARTTPVHAGWEPMSATQVGLPDDDGRE